MDEYVIDNWVDKMDLLCENEFKIGLLGSMYFVGVVPSTVIAPPLADAFGRKYVFAGSNLIQIVGLVGLLITKQLYVAYVFMALVGFSFGGMIIVGINYVVEL